MLFIISGLNLPACCTLFLCYFSENGFTHVYTNNTHVVCDLGSATMLHAGHTLYRGSGVQMNCSQSEPVPYNNEKTGSSAEEKNHPSPN